MPEPKIAAMFCVFLLGATVSCLPHGATVKNSGRIQPGEYACTDPDDDALYAINIERASGNSYIVRVPEAYKSGETGWTVFSCPGEGGKIICRPGPEFNDPDDQDRYVQIEQLDSKRIAFTDHYFGDLYGGSGGGTRFPPDGAVLTRE